MAKRLKRVFVNFY